MGGEVGGDVGTASEDSVDRGRFGRSLDDSDGESTRGDCLSDGRCESGRGGCASEVGSAVSEMLGVDIHTLPCSLDGSFTVVFVACSRDSGSDS